MRLAKILSVTGLLFILLACTIPFSHLLSERLEDILFFRVIMLGSLCLGVSNTIYFWDNVYMSNMLFSLTGGMLGLFITSTIRLLKEFDTKYYFYVVIFSVIGGMIIITLLRIWFNKASHYSN